MGEKRFVGGLIDLALINQVKDILQKEGHTMTWFLESAMKDYLEQYKEANSNVRAQV